MFSPTAAANAYGEVVYTYPETATHAAIRCSLQLDTASEGNQLGGETLSEEGMIYCDVLDGSGTSIHLSITDRLNLVGETRKYEVIGRSVKAAGHEHIQSCRVRRVGEQR